MGAITEWRTIAAKVEERGHPWLVPSTISMVAQEPSAMRSQTSPVSLYNMLVRGRSSGKCAVMISKIFSREISLNMFLRSSETRQREGESPRSWGWVMKRSTWSWVALTTKSIPFGTPMA